MGPEDSGGCRILETLNRDRLGKASHPYALAWNQPNASYAPFVEHAGAFYVLISGLAKHTSNLLTTGQCHVMFIADEKDSVNVFARKRVSYTCEVSIIERQESTAKVVFEKM
ncbi:MAG: pyridoxamine 5'-phosphate oxidase family protein, partial [Pirellula sp.]